MFRIKILTLAMVSSDQDKSMASCFVRRNVPCKDRMKISKSRTAIVSVIVRVAHCVRLGSALKAQPGSRSESYEAGVAMK